MFHRSFSLVVGISLLGLAGMSLGCSDSPSPSSPTPAPALVTTAPPVTPAFTLRSLAPSVGPASGSDSIRLSGEGFHSGAMVLFDSVVATVTRVTTTTIDVLTLAHAEGPVEVVVMNPDGQAGTLKAAYTFVSSSAFSVIGSPNLVAPGAELAVSWVAPSGRGCSGGGDWIAIYRVGDPDQTGAANGHSDLWYDHVCGGTSGTWKLKAPADPGEYEFRFMFGASSIARSNPIAVRG
jgi:hypothetical protein